MQDVQSKNIAKFNFLFRLFSEKFIDEVKNQVEEIECQAGDVILDEKRDDFDPSVYVIAEGKVQVFIQGAEED